MSELLCHPIEWPSVTEGTNLAFSGLVAAEDQRGWVLMSRGAGSCWNERCKPLKSPRPNMKPVRSGRSWYWIPASAEKAGA